MSSLNEHLVYQIISEKLYRQLESVDSFNTKAGLVLTMCGVVFVGYVQLLTSQLWNSTCGSILFVPELIALIATVYYAFLALILGGEKRFWLYNPDGRKIYHFFKENPDINLKAEVTKSMLRAYSHNQRIFEDKFRYLGYARYTLYISGSIFAIHLLIFLFL